MQPQYINVNNEKNNNLSFIAASQGRWHPNTAGGEISGRAKYLDYFESLT